MKLKKFLYGLIAVLFTLSVNASDFQNIDYKNIKDGAKITCLDGIWTNKTNKKTKDYYIKKVSAGTSNFSEFYSPEGEFLFSTGCQYEFIYNGSLIGYSNSDLKFYEFTIKDNLLEQRELTEDEVQNLFKNFKIIKISDFSKSTNSLKINKGKGKFILLNDTDRYFYHYSFTSDNAKFAIYPLKGFLDISKKGMIQFSHFGDNTKENPWFILLVR